MAEAPCSPRLDFQLTRIIFRIPYSPRASTWDAVLMEWGAAACARGFVTPLPGGSRPRPTGTTARARGARSAWRDFISRGGKRGPELNNAACGAPRGVHSFVASRKSTKMCAALSVFRWRKLRTLVCARKRGDLRMRLSALHPLVLRIARGLRSTRDAGVCGTAREYGRTNLGFTRDWLLALPDRPRPIWMRRQKNTERGALRAACAANLFHPPLEGEGKKVGAAPVRAACRTRKFDEINSSESNRRPPQRNQGNRRFRHGQGTAAPTQGKEETKSRR